MASFLEARTRQGRWLLRIDDLDTPRNIPSASDTILATLDAFGLYWDGDVYYQSQHAASYENALQQLHGQQLLYGCACSRKHLADLPATGGAYPNICRDKHLPFQGIALRLKTTPQRISFNDGLQGMITENLTAQQGDFIVQRKDRIIAYQLAVVIDDHLQGVNHVVRGSDLLDSTIKQIYLHHCLNLPTPHYLHVPVLTGAQGTKLSKRECAPAVNQQNNRQILFKLLELLQQNPPPELSAYPVATQLDWALQHWNASALKLMHHIDITPL